MSSSFGARLRSQRERRGVDLQAIAAETKIKLSLLEGLERDDVRHWPQGIFRRAYLRAYARAIGLDPDIVVREFLELHPDPQDVAAREAAAAAEAAALPPAAPGFRRLVTSAMAAVPGFGRGPGGVAARTAAAPDRSAAVSHPGTPASPPRAPERPPGGSSGVESGAALGEPATPAPRPEPDERPAPPVALTTIADVCTRLSRAASEDDLASALEDLARALEAVGLVVWTWNAGAGVLTPALAYGYPDALRAQLPDIAADAGNAVADACQSGEIRLVHGGPDLTGAVVVPMMAPGGCVGVLAIELRNGRERSEPVRASIAIVAAQLATVFRLLAPAGRATV